MFSAPRCPMVWRIGCVGPCLLGTDPVCARDWSLQQLTEGKHGCTITHKKITELCFGQRLRGGQNVLREFGGGGKHTAECALQNHFWRPQKLGLVWSVPLSFEGNGRESPKKWGRTYRRWGSKNVFGEGFSPNLRYVFHPPEFSTPLGRYLNIRNFRFGNSSTEITE